MKIVFLNTFEKWSLDGAYEAAQLTIGEQAGMWSILWRHMDQDQSDPLIWYEGTSWEEMITAFRYGVALRRGEGYAPIVDGMLEERNNSHRSFASVLQCYGELYGQRELFERLREWRRVRALSEKKSAFLVASNRMLWMLSAFVPHRAEELRQIPGWGKSKQDNYGTEVLHITSEYEQPASFPLDWVMESLKQEEYVQWLVKQKELKYKSEMDRQQLNRKIMEAIGQGFNLEQLQQELSLPRRHLMERIEQLGNEGYNIESLISKEVSQIPDEEQQQIWNALAEEGDKYLKPILHRVYGSDPVPGMKLDIVYDRLRLIRLRFRRSFKPEAI